MFYYSRIELSEDSDVNKRSASNKCIIVRYWYFLDKEFSFQLAVCNRYHEALMMSISLR